MSKLGGCAGGAATSARSWQSASRYFSRTRRCTGGTPADVVTGRVWDSPQTVAAGVEAAVVEAVILPVEPPEDDEKTEESMIHRRDDAGLVNASSPVSGGVLNVADPVTA